MSMKKTDLDKLKGKKMVGAGGPSSDRFGRESAVPMDRREQRERDREAGLVPFAVKLHGDLVKEIQALARERGVDLNALTDELVRKGLKSGSK
jgi:hypothetical protein